ncbi:DUF1566 domain-containing protein [Cellvibrio sp. PSBB006]|uniref:Lcl C-terminal domain-containing protein n=1 Tax=Cellvibrio sp. PSBB006 TaxID=1987723 RepID=UPI0012F9FC9F|nr:DUF1566 domain-containing protein [Cellvibrio sp. PSBB006]
MAAMVITVIPQYLFADTEKKVSADFYISLSAEGEPTSTAARCLQDHQTSLVWELKADDDSLHDKDKIFRWGGVGADKVGSIAFDDWNALVKAANNDTLCGFTDWRVPTIDELKQLYSLQQSSEIKPYFSNTLASPYWSVSAYEKYPEHAQTVHFGNGVSYYYNGYRGNPLPVHLVRGNKQDSPQ